MPYSPDIVPSTLVDINTFEIGFKSVWSLVRSAFNVPNFFQWKFDVQINLKDSCEKLLSSFIIWNPMIVRRYNRWKIIQIEETFRFHVKYAVIK